MKDFEDVYNDLPVCGWLEKDEAQLLWDFAGQFRGPILEVGCYYGRSTVLLANLDRPVYAVDPFAGFDKDEPTGEKIRDGWTVNVYERRKLFNVTLYSMRIEDWVREEGRVIGFAYLDGDHTYEGTRAQIDAAIGWGKIDTPGGLGIAIHDINETYGQGDPRSLDIRRAAVDRLGQPLKVVNRMGIWRVR